MSNIVNNILYYVNKEYTGDILKNAAAVEAEKILTEMPKKAPEAVVRVVRAASAALEQLSLGKLPTYDGLSAEEKERCQFVVYARFKKKLAEEFKFYKTETDKGNLSRTSIVTISIMQDLPVILQNYENLKPKV